MKTKNRLNYLLIVFISIFCGLVSRKINQIPLFFGDIIYAIMIYYMFRFLLINAKININLSVSLLFCFGIEFFQLNQNQYLVSIRNTTLGYCVLGQGFLLSDLFYYTIGSFIAYFFDKFYLQKQFNQRN